MGTLARIGVNAVIDVVSTVTLNSNHFQDIDASADAYSIALAAGSGATVDNNIKSRTVRQFVDKVDKSLSSTNVRQISICKMACLKVA